MRHLLRFVVLSLLALPSPAAAAKGGEKVLLRLDEALELAFPGCQVERGTVYLTKEQEARLEKLAGTEPLRSIAHPYVARKDGKVVGTAYVEAHRVRTLRETLFVVVDPERRVRRIEVLSFGEPEDYLPRGRWYGQFQGRRLDDELNLKRGIHGITGATLTARATTASVRRALALHRVLNPPPPPEPKPK